MCFTEELALSVEQRSSVFLAPEASIMEDSFLFLTNRTRGMVWEGFKHIYGSCSCDNLMLLLIRKEVELRWSGKWRGAAMSTDEASLTHPPFTHCGATQFLTSTCGTDLVFGDPCGRVLTRKTNILSNGWAHWLISCVEEKQLLCGMLRSHSKNRWLILGHYQLPLLMLLHIPLSTIKVFTLGLPRKTATHPSSTPWHSQGLSQTQQQPGFLRFYKVTIDMEESPNLSDTDLRLLKEET